MMTSPQFEPTAFGRRLRDEMSAADLDVQALQVEVRRLVKAATGDTKGTSYGTIWSYVKGQAPIEPRREVIDALARVFRVRPEWLAFDRGQRTDAEEAAARLAAGAPPPQLDYVRTALREVIPDLERLAYAEAALMSTWGLLRGRWIDYAPAEATHTNQERADILLARRLAEALLAPLQTLRLTNSPDFSAWAFEEYLVLGAQALRQIFVVPTEAHFAPSLATWEAMLDDRLNISPGGTDGQA